MYTYFLVLVTIGILSIILCVLFAIKAKLNNYTDISDEEKYIPSKSLGMFSIFCFVFAIFMLMVITNSFDYAIKVNKDFLTSGRLLYSEDEAIKFKIIDSDLKNSYYVKKDLDKVNFKFEGNKLTTTLKNASCEDVLNATFYLIRLKNTSNVLINGTSASFILRSEANKDYECSKSKNKEIKLEVKFKN